MRRRSFGNGEGFILQQSPDLNSPDNWSNAPGASAISPFCNDKYRHALLPFEELMRMNLTPEFRHRSLLPMTGSVGSIGWQALRSIVRERNR